MKKQTKQRLSFWTALASVLMLALACLILSLNSGCSGYRSCVKSSLYSSYRPNINLGTATNLYLRPISPTTRDPSQTVSAAAAIRAPVILCAEQINVMFFGGSAPSNSVLSDLQIPLTGAP